VEVDGGMVVGAMFTTAEAERRCDQRNWRRRCRPRVMAWAPVNDQDG